MEGKMTSKSFPDSETRASECFELIHSDLKSLPVDSYHKYKYFIVFVDDKSLAYWIQCLKLKSDATKAITNFEALVRVQYKSTIRRWHIDAGGEFVNLNLDDTLKSLGIRIEKSVPYMHQQNGRSERAIRSIMEKAQALRFTACLPQSWWEFCVEHAVHLHNLTPTARLDWRTPHQEIKGEKPDLAMLRVFGCGAYVYLPKEKRKNKLAPWSELMTYIGEEDGVKGFHFICSSGAIFLGARLPLMKHYFHAVMVQVLLEVQIWETYPLIRKIITIPMGQAMTAMITSMTIISHQPTLPRDHLIDMIMMIGIIKVSIVCMTMLPTLLLVCHRQLPET